MANQFVNLPAIAGNGTGAAVDVSAFGAIKTFVVQGVWTQKPPTVNIEMNNSAGATGSWAPVATLRGTGIITVKNAARWLRVRTSAYKGGPAPDVNVGGTDDGSLFASLPVPATNGVGAAVDVSTLGLLKTLQLGNRFSGSIILELSEDAGGTEWAEWTAAQAPGQQTNIAAAYWARIKRVGVPANDPYAAVPTLANLGGTDIGGGGGGPSGSVTSQWTAMVDPALGNDVSGQFGNLGLAFQTIQGALDAIPTPSDAATARRAYTIIVSPGTYDEALTVDLTHGKHVALVSWGPWNLGMFNAADWQPSGVARSIAITTSDAVVYDFINPAFSIQPMAPAWIGDETQVAQVQAPRISGQITLAGVFAATPSIDLSIECQIYGTAGAAVVGGAADVNLRLHRSRMRDAVTGSATELVLATETRFDDLVNIDGYGRIEQCFFGTGMTVVGVSPSSGTVPGFYACQLSGVFTGPAADAFWFDRVTDYWFQTNGASFAGGASRRIVETSNVFALPEQWAVQNVPASQTGVAMSAQVSTNFDDIRMLRAGYLVGIGARVTEAITAGVLLVEATINGVIVGGAVLTVSNPPGQTIAALGAVPYAAGDLIGMKYTTDVAFLPITTDVEAWLEAVEEIL